MYTHTHTHSYEHSEYLNACGNSEYFITDCFFLVLLNTGIRRPSSAHDTDIRKSIYNMLMRNLVFYEHVLYFVTRMSRNTLSESLEDEIMLLHLFEMQDRNNSIIPESSPWTPSCYSTASKKI
jgi:hypothetical protein